MPSKFNPSSEPEVNIPVWVRLVDLDLELWSANVLGKIGSYIGTPVATDFRTLWREKADWPRIQVIINAAQKMKESITIRSLEGELSEIKLEFENLPKFCTKCKIFGHLVDGCSGLLEFERGRPRMEPDQKTMGRHRSASAAPNGARRGQGPRIRLQGSSPETHQHRPHELVQLALQKYHIDQGQPLIQKPEYQHHHNPSARGRSRPAVWKTTSKSVSYPTHHTYLKKKDPLAVNNASKGILGDGASTLNKADALPKEATTLVPTTDKDHSRIEGGLASPSAIKSNGPPRDNEETAPSGVAAKANLQHEARGNSINAVRREESRSNQTNEDEFLGALPLLFATDDNPNVLDRREQPTNPLSTGVAVEVPKHKDKGKKHKSARKEKSKGNQLHQDEILGDLSLLFTNEHNPCLLDRMEKQAPGPTVEEITYQVGVVPDSQPQQIHAVSSEQVTHKSLTGQYQAGDNPTAIVFNAKESERSARKGLKERQKEALKKTGVDGEKKRSRAAAKASSLVGIGKEASKCTTSNTDRNCHRRDDVDKTSSKKKKSKASTSSHPDMEEMSNMPQKA